MTQLTHADDQDRTDELEFYLPGVLTPPFASRLERIWGKLFNHCVEPPK